MEATDSKREKRRGLILVNTGHGKGKTTAALGTALRACGYGWKICMVQFMKGTWHYGEIDAIAKYLPNFELHRLGKGFYKILGDKLPEQEHKKAARDALAFSRAKILSGEYDLIILDEINVAIHTGLLEVESVLQVLEEKPPWLHLILTGRNAHPKIIEKADLVTEMREIKHPYQQGIKAQRGIEF